MAAEAQAGHVVTSIVSVLLAVIGVAILAELLSMQSNTTGVIKAGGGAISQALCTALSPIMGGGCGTSVTSTISFPGVGTGGTSNNPNGNPACLLGNC